MPGVWEVDSLNSSCGVWESGRCHALVPSLIARLESGRTTHSSWSRGYRSHARPHHLRRPPDTVGRPSLEWRHVASSLRPTPNRERQGGAMISTDDYVWFVNRTLDQMGGVLRQLGDEHACERPDLPGANSPFGIVTHCLGVMTSWAGRLVAGREVVRDREAEFRATGDIAGLIEKIDAARVQFR